MRSMTDEGGATRSIFENRRYFTGQSVSNKPQRNVATADHGIIVNAQDTISLRTQPKCAARIPNLPFQRIVRRAVEFNNQPVFDAQKIRDVLANRDLPSEFVALEARSAQGPPQDRFR